MRNAVVTLHPLDRNAAAQPMPLVLDNKRCAFAPHLQVGTVGIELLLKNSDPTVHARMGNETLFNVGLPTWQQVTKRLDRIGLARIDCDVLHTRARALMVVSDTPYFAVSDRNGNFVIGAATSGAIPGWAQRRSEWW